MLAFRRADFAERGPLDEHFRFYRNLDIWWSLVLRDEGEGNAPRRAVALDGLPADRHDHRGYTSLPDDERDRQSKRNFYRIIDRFGSRLDLLTRRAVVTLRRGCPGRGGSAPVRPAVDDVPAEHLDLVREARRLGPNRGRSARRSSLDQRRDLGRNRLGRPARVIPDPIEIEPEDEVGVEDQPAPFVGREIDAQDLSQQRQGDRHVQVVVDGGDEAVVDCPPRRRQRRARRGRPIVKLEGT